MRTQLIAIATSATPSEHGKIAALKRITDTEKTTKQAMERVNIPYVCDLQINAQDEKGFTALMHALQNQEHELATTLMTDELDELAGPTDLALSNADGQSALHIAAATGGAAALTQLITYAESNAAGTEEAEEGETKDGDAPALATSATLADLVNQKDKRGHTPLSCAVMRGDLAAARLLVQHGADINVIDKRHNNLLQLACTTEEENIELINFLLATWQAKNPEAKPAELYRFINPKLKPRATAEKAQLLRAPFLAARRGWHATTARLLEQTLPIKQVERVQLTTPAYFSLSKDHTPYLESISLVSLACQWGDSDMVALVLAQTQGQANWFKLVHTHDDFDEKNHSAITRAALRDDNALADLLGIADQKIDNMIVSEGDNQAVIDRHYAELTQATYQLIASAETTDINDTNKANLSALLRSITQTQRRVSKTNKFTRQDALCQLIATGDVALVTQFVDTMVTDTTPDRMHLQPSHNHYHAALKTGNKDMIDYVLSTFNPHLKFLHQDTLCVASAHAPQYVPLLVREFQDLYPGWNSDESKAEASTSNGTTQKTHKQEANELRQRNRGFMKSAAFLKADTTTPDVVTQLLTFAPTEANGLMTAVIDAKRYDLIEAVLAVEPDEIKGQLARLLEARQFGLVNELLPYLDTAEIIPECDGVTNPSGRTRKINLGHRDTLVQQPLMLASARSDILEKLLQQAFSQGTQKKYQRALLTYFLHYVITEIPLPEAAALLAEHVPLDKAVETTSGESLYPADALAQSLLSNPLFHNLAALIPQITDTNVLDRLVTMATTTVAAGSEGEAKSTGEEDTTGTSPQDLVIAWVTAGGLPTGFRPAAEVTNPLLQLLLTISNNHKGDASTHEKEMTDALNRLHDTDPTLYLRVLHALVGGSDKARACLWKSRGKKLSDDARRVMCAAITASVEDKTGAKMQLVAGLKPVPETSPSTSGDSPTVMTLSDFTNPQPTEPTAPPQTNNPVEILMAVHREQTRLGSTLKDKLRRASSAMAVTRKPRSDGGDSPEKGDDASTASSSTHGRRRTSSFFSMGGLKRAATSVANRVTGRSTVSTGSVASDGGDEPPARSPSPSRRGDSD